MDSSPYSPLPWLTSLVPHRGFTAIELMIVIAIMAVLVALTGPSFQLIVERWRIHNTTEAMVNTLYFARSEALKRGGRIGIQKNPKTTPGCTLAATNQEWGCGWFVFHDLNSDGKWQNSEIKLQDFTPPPNVNVIHKSGGTSIKVDRYGMMSGLNAKGFIFAPEPAGLSSPSTRGICMSSGGRIRVIQEVPCT